MNNFEDLLKKIESIKKDKKVDLTLDEDLSIAVMNLVSIEEHFFFTGVKTEDEKYFDLIQEARNIRKELMKKLIGEKPEGEIWCLSKHFLAAAMRLIEVGSKARQDGKQKDSDDFYNMAFRLYSLFWAINLKAVDVSGIKKIEDGALNKDDKEKTGESKEFQEILKKLLDCCGE